MFNNKEQENKQSETERFLERKNQKLKLEVGRRIYISYSFFFQNEKREDVLNIIDLICSIGISSYLKYNIVETSSSGVDIDKVELVLEFENCLPNDKDCFLDLSKRFFYVKTLMDLYSDDEKPKSFEISCLLDARGLQKKNQKALKKIGIERKDELLLIGNYSRYTDNVNYDIHVYKSDIYFRAYSGNVNRKDFLEIYYEIVNELLDFNDNSVC